MIAAIRLDDDTHPGGAIAGAAVNGATDTDVFVAWVEHALVPCLADGLIVVMDNLRPHKNPQVETLIRNAGCTLRYLPPYSPDFNPIEPMWSKVKSMIRAREPRTQPALYDAIFDALESVTESDAKGFFTAMRYLPGDT
jgi:transposase